MCVASSRSCWTWAHVWDCPVSCTKTAPEISGLRRLYRQPRAPPGYWPTGGLARQERRRRAAWRSPTATRSSATSKTVASGCRTFPDEALYYKPWNKAYQDWAVKIGSMTRRSPICSSFSRNQCASSNWPPKGTGTPAAGASDRPRSQGRWTRCRSGLRRSRIRIWTNTRCTR